MLFHIFRNLFLASLILYPALQADHAFEDRNYLKTNLPYYQHNGIKKFYNVMDIMKVSPLVRHIVGKIDKIIQEFDVDVVMAPETRAIPIAAAAAFNNNKPLLIIRKAGKIPGPKYSQPYTTAYSKEILELAKDHDLDGLSTVIIDDGISSGGTILACIKLAEMSGLKIKSIFTIINHTYVMRAKEFSQYERLLVTLYDL